MSRDSRLPFVALLFLASIFLIYVFWTRALVQQPQSTKISGFHTIGRPNILGSNHVSGTRASVTDFVNVFIGTTNVGHVFPGATVPHGMAKVGVDTDSPGNHAGYDASPKYKALGFSQMHDDGTGGQPPLSNFKLWPVPTCPDDDFAKCVTLLHDRKVLRLVKPSPDGSGLEVPDDAGSPGYFSTNLTTGVRVELTATRRAGLHRYTFSNPQTTEARIIVDITNDGQQSGFGSEVTIIPDKARVMGGAKFRGSFGDGSYPAFVCADFRDPNSSSTPLIPTKYGTYEGRNIIANSTAFTGNGWGERGVILSFPPGTRTILARVGISLISSSQACENAEEEIPNFNFERVRKQAKDAWEDVLGRIQVDVSGAAVKKDDVVLFYSSLYRSSLVPADYSGENPLWLSHEPYYDSLYCNWDTYRTLFPLLALHDPYAYAQIVRSFIDIQQHEGWLPECRGATLQQYIQGGTSGDPILAEFFVKYPTQTPILGIEPADLWTALMQDAEVESPDWNHRGRQANAWKEYGYLPVGNNSFTGGMNTRQVSRTLEYAFDDFTISQVARLMPLPKEEVDKYVTRSKGFENVWNPDVTLEHWEGGDHNLVEGIRGFMQPRYGNGTFGYTEPRHCSIHDPTHGNCYLNGWATDGFYEGGPIVYSQYVPHDTARLIQLQGGDDAFIRRLDYIFDNGYFDSTNEPSQQMPFMYHYANRPGLSTYRSREAIAKDFNTTVLGLPGNDDSGAMGSFVAFLLLGLYPLPATKQVLISSPYFPRVSIWNPLLGTTTTINAPGLDNLENVYVKSIKIDGKLWHSNCYIEWEVFEKGSTIDLELTNDKYVRCGEGKEALPPSLSTGGYD